MYCVWRRGGGLEYTAMGQEKGTAQRAAVGWTSKEENTVTGRVEMYARCLEKDKGVRSCC